MAIGEKINNNDKQKKKTCVDNMFILMNTNVRSLGGVTDRHITLSERETNGILPHLTATAAAASAIISSLIMSNKATHRQTAFFFFFTHP